MVEKTIVAIDPEFGVVAIKCEVPNNGFDLIDACKKAAGEYIETPAGACVFEDTNGNFNWGDFVENIPAELCEKHGFRIVKDITIDGDYIRTLGESLVS